MKLWIDANQPAPDGYIWAKSVNEAKWILYGRMITNQPIELVDMNHDAGEFASEGGDYIELLNWFEEYMICYFPIRIHSQNPVGIANMKRIIERNGWKEVK